MEPYVPLLQTLVWVGLIVATVLVFRPRLEALLSAVQKRVETGSSLEAGPVKLGEDLRALDRVGGAGAEPAVTNPGQPKTSDWSTERQALYDSNRKLFVAHLLEPSAKAGQKYDVFIFLVRHDSADFGDVEYAEFFFGKYWGNRVFREVLKDGKIGVVTSAYGPFLCTCRVKFKDGYEVTLHRYIDFEMARLFR